MQVSSLCALVVGTVARHNAVLLLYESLCERAG